jgi:hypothetical protein
MSAKRMTRHDNERIREAAKEIFNKLRFTHLFPFGYDDKVFERFINPDVVSAVTNAATLSPTSIRYTMSNKLKLDVDVFDGAMKDVLIEFCSTSRIPYYDVMKIDGGDTHPDYDILAEWVRGAVEINRKVGDAYWLINKISRHCKTPGQWKRVFPEAIHFIKSEQAKTAWEQSKQSAWPCDLDKDMVVDKRGEVANLLAMCLLLPDPKDSVANSGQTYNTDPKIWI